MDYRMTSEEEIKLEVNITNLKNKISFSLKGAIHSAFIAVILILSGFVSHNLCYTTLSYIIFGGAIILLYITYKFLYRWDWDKDVLAAIEKSDFEFFNNNK